MIHKQGDLLQRRSCASAEQNITDAPARRHVNPVFPVMCTWLIGNFWTTGRG